jgi:hypothetical protein
LPGSQNWFSKGFGSRKSASQTGGSVSVIRENQDPKVPQSPSGFHIGYFWTISPTTQSTSCHLSKITVGKIASADTADTWFDSDLPLNFDMIAIIGNKGSGKSALADSRYWRKAYISRRRALQAVPVQML